MNIALLSNVNIESLALRLRAKHDVYLPGGYDVWARQLLDPNSPFYSAAPEDCFVIIDSRGKFDCAAAGQAIAKAAESLSRCGFYVSDTGIAEPPVAPLRESLSAYGAPLGWRAVLMETISKHDNVYPLDISELVARHGREKFYSPKMWYLSSSPFSAFGERILAAKIENILKFKKYGRKKCLALDLDGTLWGGAVGEDGVHGIELSLFKEGARFRDFQRRILAIKNTGVLLAIASKNNVEDAEEAFRHPHMLLQLGDFTAREISWRPKYESIADIASKLNIGLDSIVFVDDNPAERASVKEALPDVSVPDFPRDTCRLSEFAGNLFDEYFYVLDLSDEDRNKHRMYAENTVRENRRGKFSDLRGYLRDLNITLKLEEISNRTLLRAHQMAQKTNQFNLTTLRYSKADLEEIASRPDYLALIGQVADRFGDNGYSILIVCRILDGESAEIESFLMSCRIMDRTVEQAALLYVEDAMKKRGVSVLLASYVFTGKNAPAEKFYDSMGYSLVGRDEKNNKSYRRVLAEGRTEAADCFVTLI